MIDGDDWWIITSLIQDIYIVKKGLASESFRESLNNRLAMECDNVEVMEELTALSAFIHGI